MKHAIPETIRLHRLRLGLSQENMADQLGLSTTAYGDIERGKTDLTLSRLTQIADVLHVTPVTLLADDALTAQPVEPQPADDTRHELETLRLTVEKQQLELDKLRLEAEHYKRRYDERIAFELARSLGVQQSRERIGF